MPQTEEFGRNYASNQIARQRNPIRKLIKSFYVSRVLKHVSGASVDLGCGAGQILERLPPGSLGIELNPFLLESLNQRGLRAIPAVESPDRLNLSGLKPNQFDTLILSHVLEHFDSAHQILRNLLQDCAQLGISKVIVVVPGKTGYDSDSTHKTFVNVDYLHSHSLMSCEGFKITHSSYFPGNFKFISGLFIYHELMVVYENAQLRS